MKTEHTDEYKNLIDLLAVYAECTNRLESLQSEIQGSLLEIVDDKRKDYAECQAALSQAEAAIEAIATSHPEWFSEKRRSIKTPYGTVSFRKSTSLDVPNEEASIILIEQNLPQEQAAQYVRQEKALNLEALEKLTDAELKPFRIKRVTSDSFSVKAAKIDLGKAVKEAAEKEAA
jgi:hypothetical protein